MIQPNTEPIAGSNPYRALCAAVIRSAFLDLSYPGNRYYASARVFFFGGPEESHLEWMAQGVGLDVDVVRERARKVMRVGRAA